MSITEGHIFMQDYYENLKYHYHIFTRQVENRQEMKKQHKMRFVLPRAGLINMLEIFSKDAASFFLAGSFQTTNVKWIKSNLITYMLQVIYIFPLMVFQKWCNV